MAKAYTPFGYWPPRYLPGWHWPGISHGHRVYRGLGGLSGVDFGSAVGFVQASAGSLTLAALGHDASRRYTYAIRPVAGNAWLETPDAACSAEMETDAQGDWLGSRPAPVEWVDAVPTAGAKIVVRWRWRRPYGGTVPADFAVYCSASRFISPGSPQATADYVAEGEYSHTFTLTLGATYHFAVASRTGEGVESHLSRIIGPLVADGAPPPTPIVIAATGF